MPMVVLHEIVYESSHPSFPYGFSYRKYIRLLKIIVSGSSHRS